MKQPTGKQITSVGHYHSDTELISCQSFWYATCVQWKKIYILQCIIINSWNNQKLLFSLWAYRPFDLVSVFNYIHKQRAAILQNLPTLALWPANVLIFLFAATSHICTCPLWVPTDTKWPYNYNPYTFIQGLWWTRYNINIS